MPKTVVRKELPEISPEPTQKHQDKRKIVVHKGGPGSGHWGHAGRPGKHGGSVSSSSAMSIRTGKTAKKRQAKAAGKAKMDKATAARKKVVKKPEPSMEERREKARVYDSTEDFDDLHTQHTDWESNLSSDEIGALNEYTSSGYVTLNKHHRTGKSSASPQRIKRQTENIDSALNKSELQEDAIVYRGMKDKGQPNPVIEAAAAGKLKPGMVIQDKGYMSTSASDYDAGGFSGSGIANGVMLRIFAPKGSKGAYLGFGTVSNFPSEHEVLFPRNSKMRVVGVKKERGKKMWTVDVELVQ